VDPYNHGKIGIQIIHINSLII